MWEWLFAQQYHWSLAGLIGLFFLGFWFRGRVDSWTDDEEGDKK